MDSMRSILMMLGVFLHSANIFNPAKSWKIYSDNTIDIAGYVVQFIYTFRMPAFFVVSGFFCFLTIKKYGSSEFLRKRLSRIVIPLIVTGLTLNSLQVLILTFSGYHNFNFENYLWEGQWVSHLWFLINLIVYFVMAAVINSLFPKLLEVTGKYLSNYMLSVPIIIIFSVMPIISIMILGLNKVGFPLYSEVFGVFRLHVILRYLPYFIFGVFLASNKELLRRFVSTPVTVSFALALTLLIKQSIEPNKGGVTLNIVAVYLETLITWLSVSLCFFTFKTFFDKPSKTWLFLSDASYTVYLFHHVIVIALGLLVINHGLPGLPSMVLIIVTTLMITLCIHKYFVLKLRVASLLFNGKYR